MDPQERLGRALAAGDRIQEAYRALGELWGGPRTDEHALEIEARLEDLSAAALELRDLIAMARRSRQ